MPERIPKEIWGMLILIPLITTLARALNNLSLNGHTKFNWTDFSIQCFVGTVSGMVIGLLACWLIGENQYAVSSMSALGSIIGIAGLGKIAEAVEKWILRKFE